MARLHCPGPGQGQGQGQGLGMGPGGTVHTAPGPGPGNIMRALLIYPRNHSISPCAFVLTIFTRRNVVNS